MSISRTLGSRVVLKLILIGDAGVGKTSMIQRFVHGRFQESYLLTVGLDVSSKEIILPSGQKVVLSINDIGGQDRFAPVRSLFYQGSHLCMCVYDLTRPESLVSLRDKWLPELDQFATPGKPITKLLIGNKSDLTDLRMVEKSEAEELRKTGGFIDSLETSAKDNKNVNESFYTLSQAFLGK